MRPSRASTPPTRPKPRLRPRPRLASAPPEPPGTDFLSNGSWFTDPVPTGLPAGSVAAMVRVSGHGGVLALAAARRYGSSALFTLSGGHIFPLYDAVAKGGQPLRLVDVRH